MKHEEIVVVLNGSITKIKSAIGDLDRARAYSRSMASSNYCSSANSYLRETEKMFTEVIAAPTKPEEEIVVTLNGGIGKVHSAISNADYATSYDRSSAATTYCGYAKSTLRAVEKDLTVLVNTMVPEKGINED
jgi:hypothetical protein